MKKYQIFLCSALLSMSFLSGCIFDNEDIKQDEPTDIIEDDELSGNNMQYLHVEGENLVNEDNEIILLQGTNFGGWLHMEGWMDGGHGLDNKEYNHQAILDIFNKRFTKEEVENLLGTYQKAYIKEQDFQNIKDLGLNCVRIPFYWREILDDEGNVKDNAFDQLDFAIENCKKLGLYVILDLHGTPGGHSAGWMSGGVMNSNALWYDKESQIWTTRIWQNVAYRYKDEPTVAAYDLLNEPVLPSESELEEEIPAGATILTKLEMYDRLYQTVRAIDTKHTCIMGAFYGFEGALVSPKEAGWENVMYQTHHYNYDHDSDENSQTIFAYEQAKYINKYKNEWSVPVLAGEFNFFNTQESWRSWFSSLNFNGISWCNWAYKNITKNEKSCWGYYQNPDLEYVDFNNDSYKTISAKWEKFETASYKRNDKLCSLINEATTKLEKIDVTDFTVATSAGENGLRIFDNKYYGEDSRWTTGVRQVGKEFIEISSKNSFTFSRLDIFTDGWDFSNNFTISIFTDNAWKSIFNGKGFVGNQILNFESITTNKIRILQNGTTESWWSIYEISLYK